MCIVSWLRVSAFISSFEIINGKIVIAYTSMTTDISLVNQGDTIEIGFIIGPALV